jgi:hypothetical protein
MSSNPTLSAICNWLRLVARIRDRSQLFAVLAKLPEREGAASTFLAATPTQAYAPVGSEIAPKRCRCDIASDITL